MVIRRQRPRAEGGALIIDAAVAMAILVIAVLPLLGGMRAEGVLLRTSYQRAVAMEIVDGEAEILGAERRDFAEGTNEYAVHAAAVRNLPAGRFEVIRHGDSLRLEWTPAGKSGVGKIVREVIVK